VAGAAADEERVARAGEAGHQQEQRAEAGAGRAVTHGGLRGVHHEVGWRLAGWDGDLHLLTLRMAAAVETGLPFATVLGELHSLVRARGVTRRTDGHRGRLPCTRVFSRGSETGKTQRVGRDCDDDGQQK